VMKTLAHSGIETRPAFYPMHIMPPYRLDAHFPVADTWAMRGINLPTHLSVTKDDTRRIAATLREAIEAA
jgi:perosamine synthetase